MVFNETNKKYDYSISTYQNLFYEAQDKTVLVYHNYSYSILNFFLNL